MKLEKTVFILGAGASKVIGLPVQSELLSQIFNLRPESGEEQEEFLNIEFDGRHESILKLYERFDSERLVLADFIINNFCSVALQSAYKAIRGDKDSRELSDNEKDDIYNIACKVNVVLEDLFTLFDKIITGRETFKIYSSAKITTIHDALRRCIVFTLASKSIHIQNQDVLINFCETLIKHKVENSKNHDYSIITMNWDTCLERILYQTCLTYNNNQKGNKKKVFPDLCFYDYSFKEEENRIVSTQIKAKGFNNIKILKLHGSINWLSCPRCGRVYVDYDEDIALQEMMAHCYCPKCHDDFAAHQNSPQLQNILVTPTFLKDLNDLHLKNIWHNALIDLTEATKVVFIGYSFPEADFEMRCLLKKALNHGIKVDVVLHKHDNPNYFLEKIQDRNVQEEIDKKLSLPKDRYISFFGGGNLQFFYEGMEKYLQTNFYEAPYGNKE